MARIHLWRVNSNPKSVGFFIVASDLIFVCDIIVRHARTKTVVHLKEFCVATHMDRRAAFDA